MNRSQLIEAAEAYQKGVREGLERAKALLAEHDPSVAHYTSPRYWGNTLRDAINKAIDDL